MLGPVVPISPKFAGYSFWRSASALMIVIFTPLRSPRCVRQGSTHCPHVRSAHALKRVWQSRPGFDDEFYECATEPTAQPGRGSRHLRSLPSRGLAHVVISKRDRLGMLPSRFIWPELSDEPMGFFHDARVAFHNPDVANPPRRSHSRLRECDGRIPFASLPRWPNADMKCARGKIAELHGDAGRRHQAHLGSRFPDHAARQFLERAQGFTCICAAEPARALRRTAF